MSLTRRYRVQGSNPSTSAERKPQVFSYLGFCLFTWSFLILATLLAWVHVGINAPRYDALTTFVETAQWSSWAGEAAKTQKPLHRSFGVVCELGKFIARVYTGSSG